MLHNEQLLQYLWKYKLFETDSLTTMDDQPIVIDPGFRIGMRDQTFNAKVKIGVRFGGNVEII